MSASPSAIPRHRWNRRRLGWHNGFVGQLSRRVCRRRPCLTFHRLSLRQSTGEVIDESIQTTCGGSATGPGNVSSDKGVVCLAPPHPTAASFCIFSVMDNIASSVGHFPVRWLRLFVNCYTALLVDSMLKIGKDWSSALASPFVD